MAAPRHNNGQVAIEVRRGHIIGLAGAILGAALTIAGSLWSFTRNVVTHDQMIEAIKIYSPVREDDRREIKENVGKLTTEVQGLHDAVKDVAGQQKVSDAKLDNLAQQMQGLVNAAPRRRGEP